MFEYIKISENKKILLNNIFKYCFTFDNMVSLIWLVGSFGATKPKDWITFIRFFLSKDYDGEIYAIKYYNRIVSFIRVRLYPENSHVLLHGGYTKEFKLFSRTTRAYIIRALWKEIKARLSLLADKIIIEAPKDGGTVKATVANFALNRGFTKAVETEEHVYYTLVV